MLRGKGAATNAPPVGGDMVRGAGSLRQAYAGDPYIQSRQLALVVENLQNMQPIGDNNASGEGGHCRRARGEL